MLSTVSRIATILSLTAFVSTSALATPLTQQSPIDIITADAVYDPTLESLDFNYTSGLVSQLFHTTAPDPEEQTIQVRPLPGSVQPANTIELGGKVFEFLQFHAHAAAEHLIDGVQGAMEFHFVHRATDGSLAVVGLIARLGNANEAFENYFANLAQVPASGDTFNLAATLDLAALLPENQSTYRYTGSLTTSPFTEGVLWNVFAEQIEISKEQLEQFTAIFGEEGNSREVNALNGRTIVTDVAPVPLPLPAASLLLGLAALGLFARGRRPTPGA